MMVITLLLVTLLPLAGAIFMLSAMMTGLFSAEKDEDRVSKILRLIHEVSALALMMLVLDSMTGTDKKEVASFSLPWLSIDQFDLYFSLRADWHSLVFSLLIVLISWMTTIFSRDYMHRERGYFRFHTALLVLLTAMQWICFSGSLIVTMMGWELAGLASYLLIAYNLERDTAADNAFFVYMVNRVGGVGWLTAGGLLLIWVDNACSLEWVAMPQQIAALTRAQQIMMAVSLLLPAVVKSGQMPFSCWLPKAMDGPTPSSAIFYGALMTHAGSYLLYREQFILEALPELRLAIVALGLLTVIYGSACGWVQTHVKGTLIYASITQLGFNCLLMGWGLAELGFIHMLCHAMLRAYQFFLAPSFMHKIGRWPMSVPLPGFIVSSGAYYRFCQRGFEIESIIMKMVVSPLDAFACDIFRFEQRVLERMIGLPARSLFTISDIAAREEQMLAAGSFSYEQGYAISGLPGRLLQWLGMTFHWFEEKLVVGGLGRELWVQARAVSKVLQHGETLFAEIRYLLLIIIITLLLVN